MGSRRYNRRLRRMEKRKRRKREFCQSFNAEDTVLDFDKLYKSGLSCKENVRWKASTQKVLYDILLHTFHTKQEIMKGKRLHHGFVVFVILERGKAREAYSIHIRERALQRALSDYVLMPFIKRSIVDRNCASIKGRGEIYAEEALKTDLRKYYKEHGDNDGWILFWDGSKYFQNIIRSYIEDEFSCVGDDVIQGIIKQFSDAYSVYEWFADGRGYGLGTQFVQVAGIYAMSHIDHHIKECEPDGDKSTRYMDDTYLIVSKNEKDEKLDKYIKMFEDGGFPMNRKKCIAVPINKPFVWLKKLYSLSDTGKVVVRIGYKAVTRERHAIMTRMEWVNNGKISFFSYCNQVRSWLINVRKHYQSPAPCLVIERTFQHCYFRLLDDGRSQYAKRINRLIANLNGQKVVLLIHIGTLYMAFNKDVLVMSNALEKRSKVHFYINEKKIGSLIAEMDRLCINYVIAKENTKDEITIIKRLSVLNSYGYYLNVSN